MQKEDSPSFITFCNEVREIDPEIQLFPSCGQIVENINSSLQFCRESLPICTQVKLANLMLKCALSFKK